MKKTQAIFLFLIILATFTSCKSTQAAAPLWTELETLEEAYPSKDYIARIGYGENAQEARVLSEAELTSYFEHSVQTEVNSSFSQSMTGTKTSDAERTLTQKVNVKADMSLFAVKHTNPWFSKENRQYICCSFIDREEAWKVYESRVLQAEKNFLTSYKTALEEKDPLKRLFLLSKSSLPAEEYSEVLSFAHALSPKNSASYERDRDIIAKIPADMEKARLAASMKIIVSGDSDSLAERTVTQILSSKGFILKSSAAAYEVLVNVQPGKQYHQQSITAVPGVSVEITNGEESIFSYAKTLERQTGFIEAETFVDKKIYQAVEKELKSTLSSEIDKALLTGIK